MKKCFYLFSLLVSCFVLSSVSVKATVPTVTGDPVNRTSCSGLRDSFKVVAVDTPGTLPMNYLWQVSTDGGTSWTDASDTNMYLFYMDTMLVVKATVTMNGYKFRCVVANTDGNDTSSSALLTVLGIPPGTISGASTVCKTSSITLSDTVVGGHWSVSNTSIGTITSGGVFTGHAFGWDTVKYIDTNICGNGMTWTVIRVDTIVSAAPISGPSATCIGHYINLTNPNVTGSWTWGVSNGTASITHGGVLTGVHMGLDTVYYVFTNACVTVTSATIITIDSTLDHGVITGADTMCAGDIIHLTESVPGGTWFSSNAAVATVDASGYVTGVDQGAVTISYYLTNACGASVATHSMTLVRSAAAITNGDSLGVGRTKTLVDVTPGGVWTTTDTAVVYLDSAGNIFGKDTGIANVTYTVTNFCGTSSVVIQTHVGYPPAPGTLGGATHVCIGANANVTASVPGGAWMIDSTMYATVNSSGTVHGVSTPPAAQNYTVNVTYTVHNGFGDSAVSTPFVVWHTPIITITGPTLPTLGTNYFLRGTPAGGTWSNSNPAIGILLSTYDSTAGGFAYATFVSYVMTRQGTDIIHYKVSNFCASNVDSTFTMSIIPESIKITGSQNFTLSVTPNPSQGEFSMLLSSATTEEATIVITNMTGEKVKEVKAMTNKEFKVMMDEPAGIYLLSATTASGKYSAKIAISK